MSLVSILKEDMSSQLQNLILYHYSKKDVEQFILDPTEFGIHTFTRREKQTSDYPRIFFYLDPTDKERFFRSNVYNLYTTQVNKKRIYDLTIDPRKFINKIRDENNGVLNIDQLFKSIDTLYDGVYYDVKNKDVIAWFKPIVVNKEVVNKTV